MARERRSNSKGAAADRRRPQKKKVSILNTEQVDWIDYKDVNLLRRFMSERAKIRARRVTGNSTQQQRQVAKAIRLAREMALLPYSVRQVTQRKGGRRGDRDRDRGELRDENTSRSAPEPVESDYVAVDVEETPNGIEITEVEVAEVEASRPRGRDRRGRGVKIVLREDIDTLGKKGDLLEVADGYARNYLVPRGLAMKATKGVVAQAESMRRSRDAKESRDRAASQQIAAQLGSQTIQVKARAGEGGKLFGSVTASDVADAVAAQTGIELDRRKVVLAEPIRELGDAEVQVRLPAEVVVAVALAVVAE